jgi:hypothetical protein
MDTPDDEGSKKVCESDFAASRGWVREKYAAGA